MLVEIKLIIWTQNSNQIVPMVRMVPIVPIMPIMPMIPRLLHSPANPAWYRLYLSQAILCLLRPKPKLFTQVFMVS